MTPDLTVTDHVERGTDRTAHYIMTAVAGLPPDERERVIRESLTRSGDAHVDAGKPGHPDQIDFLNQIIFRKTLALLAVLDAAGGATGGNA